MDISKENDLVQSIQKLKLNGRFEDKISVDNDEKEKQSTYKEEIAKAVQMNYNKQKTKKVKTFQNKNSVNFLTTNVNVPVQKAEMKTILLSLNPYWIELISTITLILTLIIYSYLTITICELINNIFKPDIEIIQKLLHTIFYSIGMKWFLFIILNQDLSIGFFCMTTFSEVLKDTSNIKKFYIINFIKFAIFYSLSVVILKVFIKDKIGNYFRDEVDKTQVPKKAEVHKIFDEFVEYIFRFVGDFLGTFNSFLENITIGTMYIFLFYIPESLTEKKLLYFRFLSLIPIVYILVSLILRALYNTKVIVINVYVLPLLLGPKITIYLFFVSSLLFIKYKSLAYNVFDPERFIDPKVFSKIGSICFGLLGVLELLIGLFFPSWKPVGIGDEYLLVLCAPIIAIYDYKKDYALKFPCCKKGNMTLCFKIVILIIGWLIVIILGFVAFVKVIGILKEYISPFITTIVDNLDTIIQIIATFV